MYKTQAIDLTQLDSRCVAVRDCGQDFGVLQHSPKQKYYNNHYDYREKSTDSDK